LPLDRRTDIEDGTDLYVWEHGLRPSTARVRFKTDSTSLHLKIDHGEPSDADLAMWWMVSIAVNTNLVSGVWSNGGYDVMGSGTIDPEFDTVTNRVCADEEDELFIRLVIEEQ